MAEESQSPCPILDENGTCNIDIVQSVIEDMIGPRLEFLHLSGLTTKPSNESPHMSKMQRTKVTEQTEDLIAMHEDEYNIKPKVIMLDLVSDVMDGAEPVNYRVSLVLATATGDKLFSVELDSGSSLLWLRAKYTDEDEPLAEGRPLYEPQGDNQWAASGEVDPNMYTYKYGNNAVQVTMMHNLIRMGITSVQQVIGAAQQSTLHEDFSKAKKSIDGFLGLAPWRPESGLPQYINLVQNMAATGQINEPVFTMVGPRSDPKLREKIDNGEQVSAHRGFVILGRAYKDYFLGSPSWCSAEKYLASGRWCVELKRVRVNGQVIAENQIALIDTGTPFIVTSNKNFEAVRTALKGKAVGMTLFKYPTSELQNVSFELGGREFELQPQDFTLGGAPGDPQAATSSITRVANPKVVDANLWVLGGIFMDNLVTVFDFGRKRVGFANINPEKDIRELSYMF